MFYGIKVIADRSFTLREYGIWTFLLLEPMTFIYDLDPHPVVLYRMCKYELPTSRLW